MGTCRGNSSWSVASSSASILIVSTAGPRSRSASTRVPSCAPCTAWIWSVRLSESGLYCSAITPFTTDVSTSRVTMPPLTRRGGLGKPDMRPLGSLYARNRRRDERPAQIPVIPPWMAHFSVKIVLFLLRPAGRGEFDRLLDHLVRVVALTEAADRSQRDGDRLFGAADAVVAPLVHFLRAIGRRHGHVAPDALHP